MCLFSFHPLPYFPSCTVCFQQIDISYWPLPNSLITLKMCVRFLTGYFFLFWFILLRNESPLNLFTPGLVSSCYSWCFSRRAVFQTKINLPTSLSPTLRVETHPALRSVVPVQIKTLYPSSLKASPHLCISRFTEIFWSAVIKNFPRCPQQLHGQLIFPQPRTWSCGCEIKKEPLSELLKAFYFY